MSKKVVENIFQFSREVGNSPEFLPDKKHRSFKEQIISGDNKFSLVIHREGDFLAFLVPLFAFKQDMNPLRKGCVSEYLLRLNAKLSEFVFFGYGEDDRIWMMAKQLIASDNEDNIHFYLRIRGSIVGHLDNINDVWLDILSKCADESNGN